MKIRHAEYDELDGIVKMWLDSYRSSKSAGILSNSPITHLCKCGEEISLGYTEVMRGTLSKLLRRSDVRVLVAADPMLLPPRDLHGFIVVEDGVEVPTYPNGRMRMKIAEQPVIHYLLVKQNHRNFGIATALVQAAGVDLARHFYYSCTTPISVQIEKAMKKAGKPFGGEWAPSCARFEKGHHERAAREGAPVQASGAYEPAEQ